MSEQRSLEREETRAARASIEDALQRIEHRVRAMASTVNAILRRMNGQERRLAVIEGFAEDACEAAEDARDFARKAVYGPEPAPEDEPACEMAQCNGRHIPATPPTLAERTGHSGARLHVVEEEPTSTRLVREIEAKRRQASNGEVH